MMAFSAVMRSWSGRKALFPANAGIVELCASLAAADLSIAEWMIESGVNCSKDVLIHICALTQPGRSVHCNAKSHSHTKKKGMEKKSTARCCGVKYFMTVLVLTSCGFFQTSENYNNPTRLHTAQTIVQRTFPGLCMIYDADTFNDLTYSRARLGLLYEHISRPPCPAPELLGGDDHVPIASIYGELLLNQFPALCKYKVRPLCLSRPRILRTECGDQNTIGIRQERVREFLLYVGGQRLTAVSICSGFHALSCHFF